MKLFIFKIKLLLLLFLFFVQLAANISDKTKPIILAFFLILLVGMITLITSQTKSKPEETTFLSPIKTPKNLEQHKLLQLTDDQLQEELNSWLKVFEFQPKSRDVLLNISMLYATLGDEQRSQLYLEKAKIISPNTVSFK